MSDIVITGARRTPVGSFLGSFASTPAHELGRIAIEAALAQAGVDAAEVQEAVLGQVLTAGQGVQEFSLAGTSASFGTCHQYHLTPTVALGGSLKWTVGRFTTVKLDNVTVDGLDIKATTARFNLGFTWYPNSGGNQ